jgi:predicted phage-related endonuclease
MAATLDGLVKATGAVFEAKFMLPWSFSEEAAAEKHMAQLQHNMLVTGTKKAILSIITGGGTWVELSIDADPIYQTILIAAEKAFWQSVKNAEPPALFDCEPPKPRIEAVRVVDMNASNSWAELASLFSETRNAHADHERAKSELKALVPEDAKEAVGHGVRAKRSKSGAISFDLVKMEVSHASIQ